MGTILGVGKVLSIMELAFSSFWGTKKVKIGRVI